MPTSATAYYPYDSGAGANVTEAAWRNFMGRLHPSAVIAGYLNELAPFGDSTGMQVKVNTGATWVRGAYGEWTTGTTILPIAAVGGIAGGSSRIDSVVARNDFVNNRVELDVLTGTAGVTPSAPALTQSSSVWEILIGNVGPLTNATSTIAPATVLDGRWRVTASGLLFHELVTVANASSVTLPAAGSIPATGYRHFELAWLATSDQTSAQAMQFRLSGDSGTNYTAQFTTAQGVAVGTGAGVPATSGRIGVLGRSTDPVAGGWARFLNAFAGSRVSVVSINARNDNGVTNNFGTDLSTAIWSGAPPATSLTLMPSVGSILSGARFTLSVI